MSLFTTLLVKTDAHVIFPLRVWYARNEKEIRTGFAVFVATLAAITTYEMGKKALNIYVNE